MSGRRARKEATPRADARASLRCERATKQLSLSFDAPEPVAPPVVVAQPDHELRRAALEAAMSRALGLRVELALTDNRRTMISTRRAPGSVRLRLHRMFVDADPGVLEALGRYVKNGDRRAGARLGEFIERQRPRYVAAQSARALSTAGWHHDLAVIFARLERTWFPGVLAGVAITWGRSGLRGRRRKRSIRLGTYTHEEKLIRVHPVLDQDWVPRFFVEYVVFHEMLHHVLPGRELDGRTLFHTPEFRERERAYPDYARAIAWERANIKKLLAF